MRASSTAPTLPSRKTDDEPAAVQRRVLRSERPAAGPASAPITLRLARIDPQLLAMARGDAPAGSDALATLVPPPASTRSVGDAYDELDPATVRYPGQLPPLGLLGRLELDFGEEDDPFGGLIPVEDAPLPLDEPFEEILHEADILEALPAPLPATWPARLRSPR
jgi:hypothetical protein